MCLRMHTRSNARHSENQRFRNDAHYKGDHVSPQKSGSGRSNPKNDTPGGKPDATLSVLPRTTMYIRVNTPLCVSQRGITKHCNELLAAESPEDLSDVEPILSQRILPETVTEHHRSNDSHNTAASYNLNNILYNYHRLRSLQFTRVIR